jgi:rubredoxin
MKYRCLDCGYIYDNKIEEVGFMTLDNEWVCPECNAPKSEFEPVEEYGEELEDAEETIKTEDEDLKNEYLL